MKEPLRTEIIAVGTELLLGQIANTNAQWMSQELAKYGINTYYHTVVGDNMDRLTATMKRASERSNVMIVSGGLGPTEDDLSREAFQKISGLKIVREEAALEKIIDFYKAQKVTMTKNNERQARVFEDSTVLINKYGMAPGNLVEYEDKIWIFLPGVPREMKQIFADNVLPYLRGLNGEQVIESLVLRFIGIGESILEDKLFDLITNQQNPTIAPLSDKDGITIRLTANARSSEQAKELLLSTKAEILERVGDFYYGENDKTIEERVFNLLQSSGKTLAAAESLTGGAFQSKLVSVSGAATVFNGGIVSYSPAAKIKVLKVAKETIDNYGTVSSACAKEMARNVSEIMDSNLGIAFTGVAGPDSSEGKDVGTVFISLYDRDKDMDITEQYHFLGNRKQIRHRAVVKGFEKIFKYLKFDK
ncbi:MAG TPA: competence/damage-inducible protein A [Pseudogracilibacillus sp.]|nr:competence/damage-inducible protein A [Pseudogracilibacillus sp.]